MNLSWQWKLLLIASVLFVHMDMLGASDEGGKVKVSDSSKFANSGNEGGPLDASRSILSSKDDHEATMLEKMVIGIRTTKSQHDRVRHLQTVWSTTSRERMIEVYSDVAQDDGIANMVHTLWNKSDEYSTWMKMTHMMKVWSTPQYKSVNWFVVSHDGAYLNLDNLYEYVLTLNASTPMLIGELQCKEDGLQYPDWKASIILSRGFLQSMVWDYWYAPERSGKRRARYNANYFWGEYVAALAEDKIVVELVNHPGMLSTSYTEESDLLAAYISHTDSQWPYPFRPISSDQTQHMEFMQQLDDKINALPHTLADKLFVIPSCQCKPKVASRCLPDAAAEIKDIACLHSASELKCLGCVDCH